MSGECDTCGEHCLDCACTESDLKQHYAPKECAVLALDLLDELTRVRGLNRAISLLVNEGEHKLFKLDPVQDLFIILDEKIDGLEEGLKGMQA